MLLAPTRCRKTGMAWGLKKVWESSESLTLQEYTRPQATMGRAWYSSAREAGEWVRPMRSGSSRAVFFCSTTSAIISRCEFSCSISR